MSPEPWQKAEIGGTKKALVITKSRVVSALIKRSKKPIMIVGHEALENSLGDELLIDYVIRLAKVTDIPVVATAHTVKEFDVRDHPPAAWMPLVDICNRLVDQSWSLDGEGQHDLAIFVGQIYHMQWLMLSALKHGAPGLKTISLDRFYQPHATWSFPNLSIEKWKENLDEIVKDLEG